MRDPFVPNFIRPVPDYDPEELKIEGVWLTPGVLPEPYWDYALGSDVAQMKKLMKKIHEQPLSKQETELIIDMFNQDPELLVHYGFHPSKLPQVIHHNKDIAIEFLNKMTPNNNIAEYYNVLL